MANKKIAEERKPKIMVKGVVDFYGHVDNYNKDGKEYVLTLKDYEFTNLDPEEVKSWYTNERGKTDLPAQWESILNGDTPEKLFFRSNYPVKKFQTLEEVNGVKQVVTKDIDYNPDLKGCEIKMTCFRQYIGSIAIKELPPEFKKVAFDASEFDDL